MSDKKSSVPCPLTARQREVLQLVADGWRAEDISDALHVTTDTLKHHGTNIRDRLGADNTPHAVAIGFRKGWLE